MALKQSESLIFSSFLNSLKAKICDDFNQILRNCQRTALLCIFKCLIQLVMTCTYLVYIKSQHVLWGYDTPASFAGILSCFAINIEATAWNQNKFKTSSSIPLKQSHLPRKAKKVWISLWSWGVYDTPFWWETQYQRSVFSYVTSLCPCFLGSCRYNELCRDLSVQPTNPTVTKLGKDKTKNICTLILLHSWCARVWRD